MYQAVFELSSNLIHRKMSNKMITFDYNFLDLAIIHGDQNTLKLDNVRTQKETGFMRSREQLNKDGDEIATQKAA